MKKIRNVVVATGAVEEFFERAKEHAIKLDRGEKLPEEFRITFDDPADMLRALSPERVRILYTIRDVLNPTISGLALMLKRDRKAVSRDVRALRDLGLLTTQNEPNPGHGIVTVVKPLARKYHLTATL